MKMKFEYFKEQLINSGADLAACSDITSVGPSVRGEFIRGISIGVRLDPSVVNTIKTGPTRRYEAEYVRVNEVLAELSEVCSNLLTEQGCRCHAPAVTTEDFDPQTLSVPLPHKTIATLAGTGWIGKNGLLVTRKYGPAIRLTSVLTDAPFQPSVPVKHSFCGNCMECCRLCPANAITGNTWFAYSERHHLVDAHLCNHTAKKLAYEQGIKHTICGVCIAVCPFTKKKPAK